MKKIARKFNSFVEEEKAEIEYWKNASPTEKFETLQAIRFLMIKQFYPEVKGIKKVINIRKLGEEPIEEN